MANPFPGMNPYLEDPNEWGDVHTSLMTYIRDALQPHLVPKYVARLNERVYTSPWQARIPDVLIIERQAREKREAYALALPVETGDPPFAEPLYVLMSPVEEREAFIEIRRAEDDHVVTVIELSSPTNKTSGEGRKQYVRKQRELIESETNLVEIDLLALGKPTLAVARNRQGTLPPCRYLIDAHRPSKRYLFEAYPIPLQEVLPKIRIPLNEPDQDVSLNLQSTLNRAYENGGYDSLIDYHAPPRTLLSAAEAQWVDELLREKKLR
ncbi:MAG: DUF4058 family protein [Chloroflexi bacterium]|nr:DUF4058 family protein [Chloroflexota bacterium]